MRLIINHFIEVRHCLKPPSISRHLRLVVWIPLVFTCLLRGQKHPVTVDDCVSLHRIVGKPAISPDGTQVAFVVKLPNIQTNRNEYQVRLRSLRLAGKPDNGRVLLTTTEEMTDLHWTDEARHLTVLINRNRTFSMSSRIAVVDVNRAVIIATFKEPAGILEYAVSADGNTFAYTTPIRDFVARTKHSASIREEHGLVVTEDYPNHVAQAKGAILTGDLAVRWIHRKDNRWIGSTVQPTSMASNPERTTHGFRFASRISLSTDGRYLAFVHAIRNAPAEWTRNRTVKAYQEAYGSQPIGVAVYDLRREAYIPGPEFPEPSTSIWWSDDGGAYAVMSAAPIGSRWEKQDAAAGTDPKGFGSFHLFAVNVQTGVVTEALSPSQASGGVSVIAWERANSKLLVQHRTGGSITTLKPDGMEWIEERTASPLNSFSLDPVATVDGVHFVGVHEDARHPPDLWAVDSTQEGQHDRLTTLNPDAVSFTLGDVSAMTWKNRYGALVSGKIVYPPGYSATKRYPLVIMLTWPDTEYLCDCKYTTSFAPQPLANVGFVVAIFNVYDAVGAGSDRPSGPPQTREAEATVASVEALIESLDKKGTIEKNNVGIIGFSRSSWKVDYLLTHSSLPIRAASSADGGLGNYGGLWLYDGGETAHILETSYAGSFWGVGRAAWLEGSPAFNADRISAPLLMEYTGNHGITEQPWTAYELHTALKTLGKPVELIFYPEGSHPLDTPSDRVGSLQRNVDWFRFWMQGYEGKAPQYDPDQYSRWRQLRDRRGSQSTSNAASD